MPADTTCVTLPGPWKHRYIQANGAQFHLAHAGEHTDDRPLVLLVHGFPQYWWAWRHQIEPLAAAGYEVAAIDQRGIGGSDKTPNSADGLTLAQDLGAIIRSLGSHRAVIVGFGNGGSLAWSAASMDPEVVAGIMPVSAPHPRTLHRVGVHVTLKTWKHVLSTNLPVMAKRGLRSHRVIHRFLTQWSAPGNTGASGESDMYAQAMKLPGAANVAVDQLRWTWLSQHRPTGRRYLKESANPISVPVCTVRGEKDPLLPNRAWNKDGEFAVGPYERIEFPHAGHFVPEEQPAEFTRILLDFLARF